MFPSQMSAPVGRSFFRRQHRHALRNRCFLAFSRTVWITFWHFRLPCQRVGVRLKKSDSVTSGYVRKIGKIQTAKRWIVKFIVKLSALVWQAENLVAIIARNINSNMCCKKLRNQNVSNFWKNHTSFAFYLLSTVQLTVSLNYEIDLLRHQKLNWLKTLRTCATYNIFESSKQRSN